MKRISLQYKSKWFDCGHDGCSGGENTCLTIKDSRGVVLAREFQGGCYGDGTVDFSDTELLLTRVLTKLGYEVTLIKDD